MTNIEIRNIENTYTLDFFARHTNVKIVSFIINIYIKGASLKKINMIDTNIENTCTGNACANNAIGLNIIKSFKIYY